MNQTQEEKMKNLKIGARLAAGFALVLTLTLFMTAIGLWRLGIVAHATEDMANVPLAKERMISDWYRNVYSGVRRTSATVKSSDPSLVDFFKADTVASTKGAAALQDKIEPLLTSPEEKTLWQEIQKRRKVYIGKRDEATRAKLDGNLAEAGRILEQEFMPGSQRYMESIEQLLEMQRESINASAQHIHDTYLGSRVLLLVLCVAALALGVLASVWLTVGITRPLGRALRIARSVADGDLATRIDIDSRDETGQLLAALKDMNDALTRTIGTVREGIESIVTATGELSSGNQDLSARTEQQAASLEETSSSMEELGSTVRQNADSARQANALAQSAAGVAGRGFEAIGQVMRTMEEIDASASRIADIIGVIDGIAFQTNILALNAAVEAARAGEQGRGFAVVASEVRTLAQRSAVAAREIKELIGDSVNKVQNGSRQVDAAGGTMRDIVDSVARVRDIIAEISAATEEQDAGIAQVNVAMSQMDETTQQNAALVEQATAASEAVREQAARLAQAAAVFRLADAARASAVPQSLPAAATPSLPAPQRLRIGRERV
jgi:methyl-accepting chemotaxis protein